MEKREKPTDEEYEKALEAREELMKKILNKKPRLW